ncbi:PIN domain-like protein, partial [Rhizoctonia solani]
MGVHGLTTFLRENRRVLSKQETFSNTPGISTRPLVIDGWSLIFALYNDSGLPWAYGGEYEGFATLVKNLASAWIAVGLEPYFVFDGPVPLAKTPTTLKRYTESVIQNSNIFFRTSASARSTPSFLASTRIIPPLLLETCLSALRELAASKEHVSLRPHILMADGEADPYCVSLAGKLENGLVLGLDSDFAVLSVEGYGGYIPLDEMTWSSTSDDIPIAQPEEDSDGFTAVQTKQRPKRKPSGLIPPASTGELSLSVAVYHPQSLASFLSLPSALLPLFSALVGNDFSNSQNTRKFFEHRSSPIERIWKVARSVSAAIKKSNSGVKEGGDAVLDVIQTAVSHLLIRPDTVASGEMETIVDQTVEAALECTIPAPSPLPASYCAVHAEGECPLSSLSPELLSAYRDGSIHPRLVNAITTGIVFPKLFLEDPEQKACGAVCKTIWDWIWAVFTAGGHISFPATEDSGSTIGGTESRADDDSELISVVEEFTATDPSVSSESDGLASELKERLKGLVLGENASASTPSPETKSIVQYARRGLKLVPEPIHLPTFSDLPTSGGAQDWIEKERISVFLRGTRSHTPMIIEAFEKGDIKLEKLLWICVIRCVVQSSPSLGGNSAAPAVVGKWRKSEARSFIGSLSFEPEPDSPFPPLDTRTIQRTAQLLYTFDASARLAEVLYLFGGEVGKAVRMFSGRAAHSQPQERVDEKAWELVCDEIEEDVWAHEPDKIKQKAKKKAKAGGRPALASGKSMGFNVLASLGSE